jgi:lipopolysaccharide transport system permease protein
MTPPVTPPARPPASARRAAPPSEYAWPRAHAAVVTELVRREVTTRYRQSWLGSAWIVITPLLMLAIYVFVLGEVMQVRWGEAGAAAAPVGASGLALRLFAGLAVFGFIGECVARAPALVAGQPHLVKKLVFPLGVLAWVNVGASLVPLAVAWALLLALAALQPGPWPPLALALPLAWLPLVPLGLGLSWLLAALGAYVRDVGHVAGLVMSALLFLSPIFFPLRALPAALQPWLALNPMALPIEFTRALVTGAPTPAWSAWALHLALCCAFAALAAWVFHRLRPGFADVV